jgi:hypothetical protein
MMSVTSNHVVFALSSASTFFVCYVGSKFLSSVLNDAGYDLFGTILGVEKNPENMSSQLIKDFSSNQLAQLVAIALTFATSAFLFFKFSQSAFGLADMLDPG